MAGEWVWRPESMAEGSRHLNEVLEESIRILQNAEALIVESHSRVLRGRDTVRIAAAQAERFRPAQGSTNDSGG